MREIRQQTYAILLFKHNIINVSFPRYKILYITIIKVLMCGSNTLPSHDIGSLFGLHMWEYLFVFLSTKNKQNSVPFAIPLSLNTFATCIFTCSIVSSAKWLLCCQKKKKRKQYILTKQFSNLQRRIRLRNIFARPVLLP